MNKTLFAFTACVLFASVVSAQEPASTPTAAPSPTQEVKTEFDKKWRFGLRVTPQPSWFSSSDKNNTPAGAILGIGFGLNVEYRFSDVAGILTGIGGDFEGGKYKVTNDPVNNYVVTYARDADEFVAPDSKSGTSTQYVLKDRTINTTHVTIPAILKLSTQEYSGLKYFGMFGLELGIRIKAASTDSYYQVRKIDNTTGAVTILSTNSKEKDINLSDETSLIPARLGLNAGFGTEYRLGGTTSFFASVNFFRSFTNLMKKESKYTYYRIEDGAYRYIKQGLFQNSIRINLGFMF